MASDAKTDKSEDRTGGIISPGYAPQLDAKLAQRLSNCTTLPSPPAIVSRLLTLCEQPYLEMEEFEHLIRHDPALTARLLRAANSPIYGYRSRATTLRQAMLFLGVNGAVSLALTFTVALPLQQSVNDQKHFTTLWQRSALSALIATELGQRLDIKELEQLFLSSLLQDIGMFALLHTERNAYSDFLDQHTIHHKLEALERSQFGASHAEIGAWLLSKWRVPPSITDIVAHSHTSLLGKQTVDQYLSCVILSWNLADYLLKGQEPNEAIDQTIIAGHNLFQSQGDIVSEALNSVDQRVPQLNRLFDSQVLDIETRESMLERARELMLMRNLQMIDQTENLAKRSRRLQARAEALQEQVAQDGLTGLHNRSSLDEMLDVRFVEAIANQDPLSVLMIDLDHFKNVNDRYGHLAGDHVLRLVADTIRDCIRDSDFAARYGGDEFVVLLSAMSSQTVRAVASRIVTTISNRAIRFPGAEEAVTVQVSIGIATLDPHQPYENVFQLMHAADQALYVSKGGGRNRIMFSGEQP